MNIGNISHPFVVRCLSVKIPVEKILVFVQLLAHLLPLPAAANFSQQAIFLHDMEDGFRIVVDPHISFQPLPHPSVAVGMKAFDLLLPDCLGKGSILFRMLHPLYKAVIAASGHCKELAHDEYWILFSMTVNHRVLCLRAHFLSVDRRKSRSNSFSIFRRLFSFS